MTMGEAREGSEGSTVVSGPGDSQQAGPSNGPTIKPIHSFFGGSNGSSAGAGPSQTDKAKKRRKKADDTAQGTLSCTGDGWAIAKQQKGDHAADVDGGDASPGGSSSQAAAVSVPNGPSKKARGKRRAGIGDEEAEMRDMSQGRMKATGEKHGKVDSNYIGGGSPEAIEGPSSNPSNAEAGPSLRKSPRKRKTKAPQPALPEIIHLSSDPPEPPDPIDLPQPRPLAQLKRNPFSRTVSNVSTSSKGAHNDPIDVDEHTGPRKIVFAADQKPAHTFFTRRPPETQRTGVPLAEKSINGDKPVHAFFANGFADLSNPGELKDGWGRGVKAENEWPAPLPGGPMPSHTGYSTTVSEKGEHATRREIPDIHGDLDMANNFWKATLSHLKLTASLANDRAPPQASAGWSVLPMVADHPAIRSMPRSPNTHEIWTELFAPREAAQALGNEVESEYLLEWLRALSVGSKKRHVFRKVARTKALERWIVDDLTPLDDGDEDEEYDTFYEPPLALGERPLSYPPLEDRLAGCMLLTGPSGTGKSASVYAAANELGWEVFEVNPGMGKRTGAGLMSWIGDVGRNHLVQQNSHDDHRQSRPMANGADGSTGQGSKRSHKRGPSGEYRQSLILIEEADILFQEEQTFWPTIISLIAGSRRPVILTCNEPLHIPIDSLPLQAILYFHPAPSYLAIPYLEAVTTAQDLDSGRAVDLYHRCVVSDGADFDIPLPPNGNEPLKRFDLRKAITQLQLDRLQPPSQATIPNTVDELHRAEVLSFADSFIAPKPSHILEIHEIDRHEPDIDDELGVLQLVKSGVPDHLPVLLGYDKCLEMSDYVREMVGGSTCLDLSEKRARYIRSTLSFLDPLVPLSAPLLPRSSLFTDTIPIIQSIVHADDILEQAEDLAAAQGQVRLDKKTGRPRRSGGKGDVKYQQWFELDEKAVQAVRDLAWAQ